MIMKRDFTISPKTIEEYAKEIDPHLFDAVRYGYHIIYFEVDKSGNRDPYPIAEGIAKKTGTKLISYNRGETITKLGFSLTDVENPLLVRGCITEEVSKEFGHPHSFGVRNPDINSERDIQRLKESIEKRLLSRATLSMPTAEELKRSIHW